MKLLSSVHLPALICLISLLIPSVCGLPILTAPDDTTIPACDNKTTGPFLRLRREIAVQDFARLYLVEKRAKLAFDKWIPGRYTQQNVEALPEQQGRDRAIKFLTELQATPGMTYSNIHAFAGHTVSGRKSGLNQVPNSAFGLFHFRRRVPGTEVDWAIMDMLGFTGTCFTDHWDAKYQIFGNETNPIAYF